MKISASFLKIPRFRFIDHNVSRYIEVPEPLDFILHFASPASPVDYLELPIPTLKVGALGTHNTLGLAKAKAPSSAGIDVGGLWRPVGAAAERRVLGQRQSHRSARRLR